MYPAKFEYFRADSLDNALDLLSEHADHDAELLAGGHSLLPMMKQRLVSPDVVIDISGLKDLAGIERNGKTTSIGALTRFVDIITDDETWEACTPIAEAVASIEDRQVRNMGTIGGNIANAAPAADLPAAILASNATLVVQGPEDQRTIESDKFFVAGQTTALEEDELLTEIQVPSLGELDVGAYSKLPIPSTRAALIGVAVVLSTENEIIKSARIAVNGAFDHATRLLPVENALVNEPLDAESAAGAAQATDELTMTELQDDIYASRESRAQLLREYTERTLVTAIDRAADSSTTAK